MGPGEPELRSHASKHLDRLLPRRPGLVGPTLGVMKRGQPEMTSRLERTHLERAGQGERLVKPLVRDVEEFPVGGDVALQAQRPRLVTTLAPPPRLLEGLIGPARRLVRVPGE